MSILEVTSLGFGYQDRPVFSGISLSLERGEVLTLLGPNGSGKSTLLRCMAGISRPNAGRVSIEGSDLSSLPPDLRARKVGLMFQEHRPVFPFKAIDVVCMGRTPHIGVLQSPSPSDVRAAMAALERVHMLQHCERPYTELSGGERQLVLLARALAQAPAVILLDEPTAHLDFKNQLLCLEAIRELAAEGTTMVMSSHDPNQAFLFSRHVALLSAQGHLETGEAATLMCSDKLSALYQLPIEVLAIQRPDGTTTRFCSLKSAVIPS